MPLRSQAHSSGDGRPESRQGSDLSPSTPWCIRVFLFLSLLLCPPRSAWRLGLRRGARPERGLGGRALVPQEPLLICTAPCTPLTSGPGVPQHGGPLTSVSSDACRCLTKRQSKPILVRRAVGLPWPLVHKTSLPPPSMDLLVMEQGTKTRCFFFICGPAQSATRSKALLRG